MKKITQKLLFLIMAVLSISAFAQTTVYYEDFLNATGRGFEGFAVADGGQAANQIMKRVSDVPDLADSYNLFDESTDRPANRIPDGTARDQRAIATVGNNGTTNFPIDAYAVFTTLDLTDANSLIEPTDTYRYASFWTEKRFGTGDISTVTVLVSTAYTGDPATTGDWTILPLHSGKLGNSTNDDQKYVEGVVDLSAYNNATVTLAMHYVGSGTPWSASNRNGTYYISDVKFFVQSAPLSTKDNVFSSGISIYPNPTNSILNITKSNADINIKNVRLLDITGKVIYNNITAQPINVSNFSKGLYILRIGSKEGAVATKKVLVN